MGVFDYVRCKYPLPYGAPEDGYQTKDTPAQYLDQYEIREDGTIWHEDVQREWVPEPAAKSFMKGHFKRISERWEQQVWTGEVNFYQGGWEFSAYFVKGQLKHLEPISSPVSATGDGK